MIRDKKHSIGPDSYNNPIGTENSSKTVADYEKKLDLPIEKIGEDQADVLRLYQCRTLRSAITYPDESGELYVEYLNLLMARCLLCDKNFRLHAPANPSMVFQHIRGAKHKEVGRVVAVLLAHAMACYADRPAPTLLHVCLVAANRGTTLCWISTGRRALRLQEPARSAECLSRTGPRSTSPRDSMRTTKLRRASASAVGGLS